MLENVMLTPSRTVSVSYIFGDFARDLPDQVKSLTVKSFSYELNDFPTEMKIQTIPNLGCLSSSSIIEFRGIKKLENRG
ncbi:hypothetical protein K7X08_030142 [Anisodus acutangulus]|uniref:Uncharacterized protein n=1 Tax=Anisodus acutangulus TaxID=402998 RepID=A0A9Q1LQG1_9SOLA|nr:hypothetical protein K7X08_030142 [Anisodus acutangulus]